MTRINFSDNIHARGRELHLQTNTLDEEGKIVSTLFDGGRVLGKEETLYDSGLSDEALRKQVEQFHSKRIEAIEFFYAISARVKTVRHPQSLNKLGLQFLRWNLLDEAISEFELAIQYDSHYAEVYLHLGEAYLRRGGLREGVTVLEKGVAVAPSYADLWQKLGTACLRARRYEKALEAFRRALKINPSYDEAHFSMALCLIDVLKQGVEGSGLPDAAGCRKQAQEHLNRTAVSTRFQTPDFEEAMRRFRKGEIDRALTLLRKVDQELSPLVDLGFHDAFYLQFMYGEKGRNGEAVQEYVDRLESLIKEYPDFPDLYNKLGIGYLIQCRKLFNRALHQFRHACSLNPSYERAKRNLKLAENDGKGFLILLRAMLK